MWERCERKWERLPQSTMRCSHMYPLFPHIWAYMRARRHHVGTVGTVGTKVYRRLNDAVNSVPTCGLLCGNRWEQSGTLGTRSDRLVWSSPPDRMIVSHEGGLSQGDAQ